MHFKRLIVEHLGQALTIAISLLDRVVLLAVLLRTWGDPDFEVWSVCVATAGLVSLFDFGFSLYFNNRLMEETEQNRLTDARRTLRMANTVFGIAALVGFGTIAALAWLGSFGIHSSPAARYAVVVLAAGATLRIAATGMHSLYRAHRRYARFAFLQASGDLARIGAGIAVCVLGGGVLAVAVAATAVAVALQVIVPVVVAMRLFGSRGVGFALVHRREFVEIFGTSLGFFAQLVPIIILTSMPILYLGQQQAATGVLAAFVLMRTLSGVPRALLQQFGVILGQECTRRIAVHDTAGASAVVAEGARFYAALSGVATGLLIAAGSVITLVWTGSDKYFRLDYVIAAVAPMALTAFAVLAHNILVTTNAPRFGAAARWCQLVTTVVVLALVPVQDLGLAMLLALSVGEIIGFGPLAYFGVARLVGNLDVWFFLRECAISVGCAAIALGVTGLTLWLVGQDNTFQRITSVVCALLVNAALLPWLGLRSQTRRAFLQQFIQPRLAIWASAFRG